MNEAKRAPDGYAVVCANGAWREEEVARDEVFGCRSAHEIAEGRAVQRDDESAQAFADGRYGPHEDVQRDCGPHTVVPVYLGEPPAQSEPRSRGRAIDVSDADSMRSLRAAVRLDVPGWAAREEREGFNPALLRLVGEGQIAKDALERRTADTRRINPPADMTRRLRNETGASWCACLAALRESHPDYYDYEAAKRAILTKGQAAQESGHLEGRVAYAGPPRDGEHDCGEDPRLARLRAWTTRYGEVLVPHAPWTDSYGDGVRASKDAVSKLLDEMRPTLNGETSHPPEARPAVIVTADVTNKEDE